LNQSTKAVAVGSFLIASCPSRRPKQWPDVGASFAASLADEQRLYVGQPDFVAPLGGRHLDMTATLVVGAINQDVAGRGTAGGAQTGKDLWHRVR
jgi:hypothetical protein